MMSSILRTSIFLSLVFLIIACKGDPKVMPEAEPEQTAQNTDQNTVPFACDLISEKEMLAILNMDVNMEILDGNRNKKSPNSSSCFYKWDDMQYDVSGVMLQINSNPMPGEIPDFVMTSMNNKKWEGERSYDDPDVTFKYQDFEGLPFPAIYSRDTYKYYFPIKNTYLCSVVFNYPASPEQLDAWFTEIATKVTQEI